MITRNMILMQHFRFVRDRSGKHLYSIRSHVLILGCYFSRCCLWIFSVYGPPSHAVSLLPKCHLHSGSMQFLNIMAVKIFDMMVVRICNIGNMSTLCLRPFIPCRPALYWRKFPFTHIYLMGPRANRLHAKIYKADSALPQRISI